MCIRISKPKSEHKIFNHSCVIYGIHLIYIFYIIIVYFIYDKLSVRRFVFTLCSLL